MAYPVVTWLRRLRLALPLAVVVLLVDCTSKRLAVETLRPEYAPHPVAGNVVRLTLAYNTGAAMSLPIGPHPRWPLVVLSALAVVALLRLLWNTDLAATGRRVAIGLLLGGALGNLLSRLFNDRGVVDFIDVGFGIHRFWLFNVADVGVTAGACLLGYAFWRVEAARPDRTA